MKNFRCQLREHTVYVRIAEDEKETHRLSTLACETAMICLACPRTDLWITAKFIIEGRFVLVTNLYQPLDLNADDISLLEKKTEEFLHGC